MFNLTWSLRLAFVQGEVPDGHHAHGDSVGDDRQATHRTLADQPDGPSGRHRPG
jgi:hypothetical protein